MGKPTAKTPVLQWQGERTSPEFTAAAFALRDLIAAIQEKTPSTAADELVAAERFAPRLLALMDGNGEVRKGFAAALSHWLASNTEMLRDAQGWIPLGREPIYETINDEEYWRPPVGSQFFDWDGVPVSVTDDLVAFAWVGENGPNQIDIDLVRVGARPISEEEFRRMESSRRYLHPEAPVH